MINECGVAGLMRIVCNMVSPLDVIFPDTNDT
jgi:hypothetical protein